jgi:hypothetical protein
VGQGQPGRRRVLSSPMPRTPAGDFDHEHLGHRYKMRWMSTCAALSRPWAFVGPDVESRFVTSLEGDLSSGTWDDRYGAWRTRPASEGALRLIVGHPSGSVRATGARRDRRWWLRA